VRDGLVAACAPGEAGRRRTQSACAAAHDSTARPRRVRALRLLFAKSAARRAAGFMLPASCPPENIMSDDDINFPSSGMPTTPYQPPADEMKMPWDTTDDDDDDEDDPDAAEE